MRLNIVTSLILAPALTHGFHITGSPTVAHAPTNLAARRSRFPLVRRSDPFSDIDYMFMEMDTLMDDMMGSFLTTRLPRPSHSLLGRKVPGDLIQYRPLGFEVTQDEKTYKVAVRVPDMEAKDIGLQLDHDGRVIRLKGNKTHEDGGMKVQASFEKAILLSPDVDATKLTASMSGDTLTVVAPKIEKKAAPEKAEKRKIDINFDEPKAASQEGADPTDDTEKAPALLPKDNLKAEKARKKPTLEDEKKWPARDFPY